MFTFQNNIAVTDNGKMTKGIGSTNNIIFDYNIYFDIKNTALSFTGLSFEQWRSYGLDIHSLIADPKFINAEQGDFRLSPDSPAISLGFVPFDFREAGARCLSCSSTATPKPTSTPTSAPIKTSTPIPPTVTPSAPSVRTLTPTAILTATATNANSTQKPCKKGDTNCDLNITPGDALLAFQIYLLIYYPNGGEICDVLCSADYTGDNNITPGDALCIFREYLGNPC